MTIYGVIEDNVFLLISSFIKSSPNLSFEKLFYFTYVWLSSYVNSLYLYHIILFVNLFFSWFLLYWFLSKLFKVNVISLLCSFLVLFSSYSLYKTQNHLLLSFIWILIFFLILNLRIVISKISIIQLFLIGIFFGFTSLVSIYLSFFGLLFSVIFLGINYLVKIYQSKFELNFIKKVFIKLLVLYTSVLIPVILFNYNFIYANFLSSKESADTSFVLDRSIDDFFIFSSRPWYYFLPSVDNPFYGEYSKNILNYLEFDWGSFLAKNYFKSEHSSSYLGFVNLFLAILGLFYLRKNKEKIEYYEQIIFLGITGIILILFTMPPYLDLKGFRFYFPSFLISDYFSMFRVLSRLGILILIIQLIYTGFGFIYIIEKFKELGFKKLYSYLICIVLFIVSLSEFFIPFKFTDISKTPDVYNFIKNNTNQNDKLVILPRGKFIEGFFWYKDHQREVLNIEKDHVYRTEKILKDDFFNKVAFSCKGLEILQSYGASYFVYFYNVDKDSEQKIKFLNENLQKVGEFKNIEQVDSYGNMFYTVINTGNNFSNQSVVYKISYYSSCR